MRRNTLTFHLIVLFILLKAEAARTVRFNNSRLLSLAKTRRVNFREFFNEIKEKL